LGGNPLRSAPLVSKALFGMYNLALPFALPLAAR
jgi:hypothetical protein